MINQRRDIMNKKKIDLFSAILLLINLVFYLFFALYDGAIICVDSPSYINMDSSREPLYPMLLLLFRNLLGESNYLFWIAVFQSILAALAAYTLVNYLRKTIDISKLCTLCLAAMPFAVSILCRFVAKRGSMYSNSILTEGVTISLYMIFLRFILEYYFTQSKKSFWWCIILILVQISVRKQMLISLALFVTLILVLCLKKKTVLRGMWVIIGCTLFILGMNKIIDIGYNYVVHGEVLTHTGDIRFVSTIAFYTSERQHGANIKNEEIRGLFYEIYDACDANGYLKHSAGEGWLERVSHFGDYYDCIQIDTMWPMINTYVVDKYGYDGVAISEKADEIMGTISQAIIPKNIDDVIGVFFDNFISGLITTVAQRNRILTWYSLVIYIVYILLLITNLRNNKDSKVNAIAVITLLSIVYNVGLVSVVIFCQTRYTVYNMAMFYVSLILLLHAVFVKMWGKKILRKG